MHRVGGTYEHGIDGTDVYKVGETDKSEMCGMEEHIMGEVEDYMDLHLNNIISKSYL